MTNFTNYLSNEIKDFLFSELNDDFLYANGIEFLSNIPIPIRQEDLKAFTNEGLSTTRIADNMAFVIGADSEFKYADYYLRYLNKLFDNKLSNVLCTQAEELLEKQQPRKAVCYLRAALLLNPSDLQAMYCYANGLRIWYQSLEGEDCLDLISDLKKESTEYFTVITNEYPDFAPAWYFLGYVYLNAGAYTKANLAFKHYLSCSEGQPEEDVKEIKDRVEELKDPMRLEEGKNLLIGGRVEEALQILEPYVDTQYSNWWPLHFYLATAYDQLGYTEEAIEGYLRVLKLNPSNYDANVALSELYEQIGDDVKADKYAKKAKIVLENSEE